NVSTTGLRPKYSPSFTGRPLSSLNGSSSGSCSFKCCSNDTLLNTFGVCPDGSVGSGITPGALPCANTTTDMSAMLTAAIPNPKRVVLITYFLSYRGTIVLPDELSD